ncbi:putative signaling protein [Thauera sp. GDN1]|uniref:putative bifunctional diguanylate cyclase/phosphodiesterase n=1 Tax=Thauera sp. GDN1 TaxID=2944810 RepID=UPI00247AB8C4|nr:EAL domain-containing protein [Thauera sp. GDN1]WEN40652.1 putative signaling protein [Thauera sp. GDN1]
MPLAQSARLQQRIQSFALIGILLTGLLVALATAVPMYRHAHALAERALADAARGEARAAGQFLAKSADIARQIASRSAVRDKLEAYNRREIDLVELVDFCAPRIRDALDHAGQIAGMVRFDRDGKPVLELGLPLPRASAALPANGSSGVRFVGPFATEHGHHLLVGAPILSREGEWIGSDVLAFDLQPLEDMLSMDPVRTAYPAASQVLHHQPTGIAMAWLAQAGTVAILPSVAALPASMRLALEGEPGRVRRDGAAGEHVVFALELEEAPGWVYALVTPAGEFAQPVRTQLLFPLATIAALVLLGALLTARAMRPLTQRALEQSRHLLELSEKQRLAASVFEGSPQGIVIMDTAHRIVDANRACTTMTGFPLATLRGRSFCEALHGPEQADRIGAEIRAGIGRSGEWQGEGELLRADGGRFPAWQSITAVRAADGGVRHYIGMFSDISAQRVAEERIRHLAHHDALTNLPNRTLLNDRLGVAMDRARRSGQPLALLFIDLDRFKYVNDTLGHPLGDRLLQAVAQRLHTVLREGDTLARLGGDEFVVLVEGLAGPEDAERVARKLLQAMQQPVLLDGHELFIGGSIGISLFPQDGDTIEALVRCADSAMYRAKDAGRNTFRFHTREQASRSRERFELEHGLRHAVERGELRLLYQPQAACRSGALVGVEALVRWEHPGRGTIMPDRFIPLAEEIGLIRPIGEWVLNTACAQARAWEREGRPVRVAVNLSGQQISTDGLVDAVRDALDRSGLSPRLLELEITEGHILKRVDHCIDTLRKLKGLGVTLAIDDFGTGYSSLSYLKRLPVDRLKIDRSFVEGVPADHDDTAIVATILAMARNLGLAVIAEGVETEDQLRHLSAAHCDEYQGYLLGRPVPADAIRARLG